MPFRVPRPRLARVLLVPLARNSTGGLSFYDARPGAYTPRTLGGVVR